MPIIKTTQVILDVKDPVKDPFKDPLANWLGELYDRDKQNDFRKQILSNIKYIRSHEQPSNVRSYEQPSNVKKLTRRLLKKKRKYSRATRRKKLRKIKSRKLKPDKVKL